MAWDHLPKSHSQTILCPRCGVQQEVWEQGPSAAGEKALEKPPGKLPKCPGGHQGNSHDLPTSTQHKLKEEAQGGD